MVVQKNEAMLVASKSHVPRFCEKWGLARLT